MFITIHCGFTNTYTCRISVIQPIIGAALMSKSVGHGPEDGAYCILVPLMVLLVENISSHYHLSYHIVALSRSLSPTGPLMSSSLANSPVPPGVRSLSPPSSNSGGRVDSYRDHSLPHSQYNGTPSGQYSV